MYNPGMSKIFYCQKIQYEHLCHFTELFTLILPSYSVSFAYLNNRLWKKESLNGRVEHYTLVLELTSHISLAPYPLCLPRPWQHEDKVTIVKKIGFWNIFMNFLVYLDIYLLLSRYLFTAMLVLQCPVFMVDTCYC